MSSEAPRKRRWPRLLMAGAAVVLIGFASGPRARFVDEWVEPELPADLDAYLAEAEAGVPDLRTGDHKEIVWADSASRGRTPVSFVYLHGFSADRHEIDPVVAKLAEGFDANVFYTRLRGHGRDGAGMLDGSVEAWLEDAAEAVAIGAAIGEQVVVVGTSQGGTLGAWVTIRPEGSERIAATVLISPNFRPKDPNAPLLLIPWGKQIARLVVGPERCFTPDNEAQRRHWTTCYPTEAVVPMMAVADGVRRMDFASLDVPTLVLYSTSDLVVEHTVTEEVVGAWPAEYAELVGFSGGSDRGQHVLAGDILAPDANEDVVDRITAFLSPVLTATGS